jgi:hypothetical protein
VGSLGLTRIDQGKEKKKEGRERSLSLGQCVKMQLLFFREVWEMEGLQTVGILLVVCSSLKLMHFLGLIDFSSEGKIQGSEGWI